MGSDNIIGEERPEVLLSRLLCIQGRLPLRAVRTGQLDSAQRLGHAEAMEALRTASIQLVSPDFDDLQEARRLGCRAAREMRAGILLADSFPLVFGERFFGAERPMCRQDVVEKLRQMAIDLDVVVLVQAREGVGAASRSACGEGGSDEDGKDTSWSEIADAVVSIERDSAGGAASSANGVGIKRRQPADVVGLELSIVRRWASATRNASLLMDTATGRVVEPGEGAV